MPSNKPAPAEADAPGRLKLDEAAIQAAKSSLDDGAVTPHIKGFQQTERITPGRI